jgi:DNA-binding transcriptional regulator of glucitol operon
MMRRLLTPRWMAFTALMFTAAVVSVWLAWWQLERYEGSGGSFQNLGYTLQWPVFGAFAVYLWWRLLRDAAKSKPPANANTESDVAEENPAVPSVPEQTPAAVQTDQGEAKSKNTVEDADPELAAYNRYLAELTERSKR